MFGAICPSDGKGAALVLPACNTEAMNLHLAEITKEIAPGRHAALLLDQAGWHLSRRLIVPENITLVPLPPKCPELNPVENIWQFLRDNWISNRIFASYEDLLDHCCFAWNKLTDMPWKIMSIGLREWAHRFYSVGIGISSKTEVWRKRISRAKIITVTISIGIAAAVAALKS